MYGRSPLRINRQQKSVVIKRNTEGFSAWQKDYESFMSTVGFQAKLCKPGHPFTKGKAERLVCFVKGQEKAQYQAEWNRQLQEKLISSRKQYNTLKESERKAELKSKLIKHKLLFFLNTHIILQSLKNNYSIFF